MDKVFDVAAIGEGLIEFNQTHATEPVYLQGFGGDTSNAIIAASRAGARCAYVSRVGGDAFGQARVGQSGVGRVERRGRLERRAELPPGARKVARL